MSRAYTRPVSINPRDGSGVSCTASRAIGNGRRMILSVYGVCNAGNVSAWGREI